MEYKVKCLDGTITLPSDTIMAMSIVKDSSLDTDTKEMTLSVPIKILSLIHCNVVYNTPIPLKYLSMCIYLGYIPMRTLLKPISKNEMNEMTLEEILNVLFLQTQQKNNDCKYSIMHNLYTFLNVICRTSLFGNELFDLIFGNFNCKELNLKCYHFIRDVTNKGMNLDDILIDALDHDFEKFWPVFNVGEGFLHRLDKNYINFSKLKKCFTNIGKNQMILYYCYTYDEFENHFEGVELFDFLGICIAEIKKNNGYDKVKSSLLCCIGE